MSLETKITTHYAAKHILEITAADHLHIGGPAATRHVLSKITLGTGMHLLDIGCGVGGPARLAAEIFGCHVTGIDLTPEFVGQAQKKSIKSPYADFLQFEIANAKKLNFSDGIFDAAMMLHTGMNIPNKEDVYKECCRVLKPGSQFLIYDVLALKNAAEMTYPAPWAETQDSSFLEPLEKIQSYLRAAGFNLQHAESAQDYAISALKNLLSAENENLTEDRRPLMEALLRNIKNNACAPFILIASKL